MVIGLSIAVAAAAFVLSALSFLQGRRLTRRQLCAEADRLIVDIQAELERLAELEIMPPAMRNAAAFGLEHTADDLELEFVHLAASIDLQRTAEIQRRLTALQRLRRCLASLVSRSPSPVGGQTPAQGTLARSAGRLH